METRSSSFTNRADLLQKMRQGDANEWDIIVVGGGITGAGVLREAVRRGYRTLLVEQKDFAWGTSSRSSKMVHGGLRYLAAGDLKLTKDSLKERERLLEEAPGLVERMGYYFTLRKGGFPGRWAMSLVLEIYDWIARIRDHRYCTNAQLKAVFSGISDQGLNGACYYTDAVTDDARLVLRVLQESFAEGGRALNYTPVKQLLIENNNVCGVRLSIPALDANTETEPEILEIRAPVVINATGAWADTLRGEVKDEKRIRPLRGSHLVLPKQCLPIDDVLAMPHPQDKRAVFVYPWEGTTVVGTTDLDHTEDLNDEASITENEVDYLLQAVQQQFPQKPNSRADIISTFSGVRPVIGAEKAKDASKERRDHATWSDKGLITVSGGKLTTFRLIALDALAAAQPYLPAPSVFCDDRVFKSPSAPQEAVIPNNPARSQRLLGRYGAVAQHIMSGSQAHERQCIPTTMFCLAECRWALRHEAVHHLDDLLLRRTRLGQLLENGAQSLFGELQSLCAAELGWDAARWAQELNRYQNIWQRHYSLPSGLPCPEPMGETPQATLVNGE